MVIEDLVPVRLEFSDNEAQATVDMQEGMTQTDIPVFDEATIRQLEAEKATLTNAIHAMEQARAEIQAQLNARDVDIQCLKSEAVTRDYEIQKFKQALLEKDQQLVEEISSRKLIVHQL